MLSWLATWCDENDSLLCFYSPHEADVIRDHYPAVFEEVQPYLRNAKKTVERWRNKCHGGRSPAGERGLKDYLRLIKYRHIDEMVLEPAGILRDMRSVCERHSRWRSVPERDRQAWCSVLRYNELDCRGLRKLMLKAARGLASAQGDSSRSR